MFVTFHGSSNIEAVNPPVILGSKTVLPHTKWLVYTFMLITIKKLRYLKVV